MEQLPSNLIPLQSKAIRVEQSAYTTTAPVELEQRGGIVNYGEDNLFPQYLIELQKTCPIHGPLVESIAQMIAGKELTVANPTVQSTIIESKFDKIRTLIARDIKLHGGYFLEVVYNLDRTINRFNHLPFETCRIVIDEETGLILGAKFSRDWSNIRKKRNNPVMINRFNPSNVNDGRQVFIQMGSLGSTDYYAKPDYLSALNYIELAREIGIYHVNNIKNGFFPQYMVHFTNGEPTPEAQQEIKREWTRKSGAKDSGTTMITFSDSADKRPIIDAFPLSDADKQYQVLDDGSTKQIMMGHRVTSPLLFGIRDSSGLGSNKDEMQTGFELFTTQVIEPYQRMITEVIDEIFKDAMNIDAGAKIVPLTPLKALAQQPTAVAQSEVEKKKNALVELGEDAPQGYILIDAYKVESDDEADFVIEQINQSTGTARPNAKSEQDAKINGQLFITRYRYKGDPDPQRKFCVDMMAANKLYRKEDIVAMETRAVNPGWGPHGTDTYSIWKYKGGGNCYHFWQKEVYMSAEGFGIDVNNPNSQKIAVAKAEKMGYKVRNESLVAQLPIDMLDQGFLPK